MTKSSIIEINKSALINNITQLKKLILPSQKFIAVVKANAYGHGLLEVVNIIKNKVDYLAVYNFEDAVFLRNKKISKPILVLGQTLPDQLALALKHDIEITISTIELLKLILENKKFSKIKIHLMIDSGMHRDGLTFDKLSQTLSLIKKSNLISVYSHFASADEKKCESYTNNQVKILEEWKKELVKINLKPMFHICASAGVIATKFAKKFDMVRVGVSIYGFWPSKEVREKYSSKIKLEPVLSWRVQINEIKFLPKGSPISYNHTHILKRDSKIATLPIGYFDGISRVSSNKGFVLVNGKKVPQIGRVTMNIIVIDITDAGNVKLGDFATIIGCDKKAEISADDWAGWSQTSSYEVATRINSSLLRVIV